MWLVLSLRLELGVQFFRLELGVEAEAVVHVDGPLHVGALVEGQVVALVIPAGRPVREWRDPSPLRPQSLRSLLGQGADKPAAPAFHSQVGVQDRVLWTCKTSLAQLIKTSFSILTARLKISLQWSHKKLSR